MGDEAFDAFLKRIDILRGEEKPYPWAIRVGLGQGTYANMTKRRRIPKAITLKRVADAVGCSLEWLMFGIGVPPTTTSTNHVSQEQMDNGSKRQGLPPPLPLVQDETGQAVQVSGVLRGGKIDVDYVGELDIALLQAVMAGVDKYQRDFNAGVSSEAGKAAMIGELYNYWKRNAISGAKATADDICELLQSITRINEARNMK